MHISLASKIIYRQKRKRTAKRSFYSISLKKYKKAVVKKKWKDYIKVEIERF